MSMKKKVVKMSGISAKNCITFYGKRITLPQTMKMRILTLDAPMAMHIAAKEPTACVI